MVDDGNDTTPASATPGEGERGKNLTAVGLGGFLILLVGLGVLVYGTVRVVDERSLAEYDLKPAILGLLLLAVGLTLLQATFLRQRSATPARPVPWLTLLISCVCVAGVIGIAIFSVADAFLPRPQAGEACAPRPPLRTPQAPRGQPVAFSFPEENAGTTGLRISMGRGRPAQDTASQVLVRSTTVRQTSVDATTTTTTTTPPRRATTAAQRRRERRLQAQAEAELARARLGERSRVQVVLTELRRTDGARMVDGSVSAWAVMVNGNNMKIELCVAPRAIEEVDAGSYTGVLTIVDPRVARIDVPVRVDMQFNRWPVLVTLLVGSLIVAAFVLYNGTKQLSGNAAGLHPRTIREFGVWLVGNPVAIGTGVVAAVAIFANQYLADSVWSGSSAEVFALIGAISAAFLGAATVAAGVGPERAKTEKAAQDGAAKEAVDGETRPAKEKPPLTKRQRKRKRQRERERARGGAAPVVVPTPAVVVAPVRPVVVDDEDDDTLGHLDDEQMAAEADDDDEDDDPQALVIPGDDDVAAQGSPTLAEADATGEAPPAPEYDIPDDGAVAPVEVAEDRRAAGIPDDDEVAPGPATSADGAIPSDDPPEGG